MKKWDENTAILSGDAMLILAYQFMMKECPLECVERVMEVFGRTALEVCEGQQWDMEFEHRLDVTVDEYIEMIRLKTSVLLAAALKIGAILGGAPEKDAQLLYDFGIKMGLAFQLQDDYLDVYGDPAVFGKKIGGDILCNKKTFMLITALSLAEGEDKETLLNWLRATDYVAEEKNPANGITEYCKKSTNIPIQVDTGDFRLLDRRCIEALQKFRESQRNTKAIFSWIGYKKKRRYFIIAIPD